MGGEAVEASALLRPSTGAALCLGLVVLGCDIVQGFQNAGDALFPPVKTYLDAPGYKIVAGGYRDLNFVSGDELFLLARSSRAGDTGLYSMRYADPKPCTIPEVGRYYAAENSEGGTTWVAHFHDSSQKGDLSFADPHCRLSSLVLPEAELPLAVRSWVTPTGELVPESGRTLILRQAGNLIAADPGDGSTELLVPSAGGVYQSIGGAGVNYVYSQGQIYALDVNWRYIDTFGSEVVTMSTLSGRFYYEDPSGIHRVTSAFRGDSTVLTDTLIAADACALAFPAPSQRWLAFYSPCAENRLVVWPEENGPAVTLDLPTDPRLMMLIPDPKPEVPGPATPELERLFAYYLRDIDWNAGVGTIAMRARGAEEVVIGLRGALERTTVASDGQWGYALVDADAAGDTGRYIRYFLDGTSEEIATRTLREAAQTDWARLIVDWDGTAGTLAKVVDGQLIPVLERVPRRRYAYSDGTYTALFGDYDGSLGTLSIGEEYCPPDPPNCAGRYLKPAPVAYGVRHQRHRLFNEVGEWLPALGYLTAYDAEHDTGRFEYRNLELGFTSVVSDGVSDFLMAGNGVLYAVPFGEDAGIWLARAK
ncbi:MAG TPA: hypothetical protein VGK73_23795 [Polyangiaceae bacterium]